MMTPSSRGANPEGRFIVAALFGMTNRYCAPRNDREVVIPSEARDLLRSGHEGRFLVAPLLGMTGGMERPTLARDHTVPRRSDVGVPTTDSLLLTLLSRCRLSTVDCQLSP